MWPFKKKKKEEEKEETAPEAASEESPKIPEDAGLSTKIDMMQADITKITGTLESLKEMRKSTSERFATINEQIGELRGQINDTQRTVGMIEVKATKAADLVESVHPDKLMIQVQKEDGKIEGLRGMLEAKEEMMKNLMDQLKKLRDQMNIFRGIEQVIKLNEEVKDEIMNVKKITATVERHADRVDNVFIESQKSFEAFNTFGDNLESLSSELKDVSSKAEKVEVAVGTLIKKKDFEDRIGKIEKHDKKVKKVLSEIEEFYKKLDDKFNELEGKLKGEFEFKIEKAEIMSKSFESLLKSNPLFAKGLNLEEYLKKHLSGKASSEATGAGAATEAAATAKVGGAEKAAAGEEVKTDEKKEDKKTEGKKEKAEEKKDAPDKKLVEGMTPVKK